MRKFIDINIITGKKCNFRCKYCFTKTATDAYKEEENQLVEHPEKVIKFIDYYLSTTETVKVTFFGGEPLCYPEFVKTLIDHYKDEPRVWFMLVTNGSLIDKHKDWLFKLDKEKVKFSISYDYCWQNSNREDGTYKTVRQAIIDTVNAGYWVKTITVINSDHINKCISLLNDYTNLQNQVKWKLRGNINFAKWTYTDFDFEEETVNSLWQIFKDKNDTLPIPMKINCTQLNRKDPEQDFMMESLGLAPDGVVTWEHFCWWKEKARENLTLGTLDSDPADVQALREAQVKEWGYKYSDTCVQCKNRFCKASPLSFNFNEKPVNWGKAPGEDKQHICRMNAFIDKYLNDGKKESRAR